MAYTMTKIASTTVGAGGTSTITFSSIPQTYTDLYLVLSNRVSVASPQSNVNIRFNGSTASEYGINLFTTTGSGSAVNSNTLASNNLSFLYTNGNTSAANFFGSISLYITGYSSTTSFKTMIFNGAQENDTTTAYLTQGGGSWQNNSAITSMTLESFGNTWLQHTTATLYGVTRFAQTNTGSKAIGGTVTTSGGYTYHTYLSSGLFTPTTNISNAEVLVVAGGGGGGHANGDRGGGGGGAGGLIYASGLSLTSGTNYAAIVGAGGAAAQSSPSFSQNGSNGTLSRFGSQTIAQGGGGGGVPNSAGSTGGSGGGAVVGTGAAGVAGQGNAGGNGLSNGNNQDAGGGGGGAGTVGSNGTSGAGGAGGAGVNTYSAWATATNTGYLGFYAGGGGGVSSGGQGGNGGSGGGGQGSTSQSTTARKPDAYPFTGGGGGAGYSGTVWGGNGASGVVIVRYTT